MTNHPNRSPWIKGNNGTSFLQFMGARITRTPDGAGGFTYRTSDSVTGRTLYAGPLYESARLAITAGETTP